MLGTIGTVLLLILKMIGILLLVILGLLLLVLFVPIRYGFVVEQQEETVVKGAISWMGFVIRIPIWLENNKLKHKIRVFGIPIKGKKKKGKKKEKKPENNKKPEEKNTKEDIVKSKGEGLEEKQEKRKKNKKRGKKKDKKKDKKGEKKSIRQRLADWKDLILDIFHKVKELKEAGQSLHDIITSPAGKGFVCIIKKNLLYLWKKIRPRIRGWVVFGTGDPCSTGEMLGGISMFYAWIGRKVQIAPDFEKKRLEGHLKIRGRITLFTLLFIVLKVITNKDFKKTYSRLKRWKENL